jgi:hypothetical protein
MSTTYEQLQVIGKSAADSIAEMVAALECDYDRLEELREQRKAWLAENPAKFLDPKDHRNNWPLACPDESDELAELAEAAADCESREEAEQRIHEDPLSIELTGTWSVDEEPKANKAYILLGTGGPATRIVVELTEHMEPGRAYIQAQDWGTPWTDCLGVIDQGTLLTYCQQFYFGEG